MIYAIAIALTLISSTKIVALPDTEIVRRANFVVAATVNGFLCYGTKAPQSVRCHRAVQRTQFGESAMLLGPSYQAEVMPTNAALSVIVAASPLHYPLRSRPCA